MAWELRARVVVDDECARSRVVNDRRASTASLVGDDDELRAVTGDRGALGCGVDVRAFGGEVHGEVLGCETEVKERVVDDEAAAESVGVFVGQEEGERVCGRAAIPM